MHHGEAIMSFGTSRLRAFAVAVTLLLGLGAATVLAAGTASADTAVAAKTADSIQLRRTGGFLGVDETYQVTPGNPSPETPHLLALAGNDEFLALDPVYGPKDPCCDFFIYRLSVHYTDGTTKSVLASDAVDLPAVLNEVIGLTIQIGTTAGSER
jgi:hypothetical protein